MGERVVLFDDLDGTEDSTVERHRFQFEGVQCEIDLTAENWGKLYLAVKPFLDRARQDGVITAPQMPVQPRKRVEAAEVPKQREPKPEPVRDVPLSGGFGDYVWESDGTMPPSGTTYATLAEMNACARWTYAHMGKRVGGRASIVAFRKQDERLIPGWADPPSEEELAPKVGNVGLVLRDAVEEKRARDKAPAR